MNVSADGVDQHVRCEALVPWIDAAEVEVVASFPAPSGLTALHVAEDNSEMEGGTVVGFLVLQDREAVRGGRSTTVVGVVADEEGTGICEDVGNFIGYRRQKDCNQEEDRP